MEEIAAEKSRLNHKAFFVLIVSQLSLRLMFYAPC
jgi:hypothetical protein